MIELRDGSETKDIRLDRLNLFDEQSKEFPVIRTIGHKKPRSYTWRCSTTVLDQGAEGACVGFGIAHELLCRPAAVSPLMVNNKYAREKIYWEAQRTDIWNGGSYPGAKPFYEGTSVISGVKVIKNLGWIDNYEWSFGLEELILGVGYKGPAVLGVNWFDTMYKPDSKYFIYPSKGKQVGGHCILCNGVNLKKKLFVLHNSWGSDWGFQGNCFISFDEMDFLLKRKGEAVFFSGRRIEV